MLKFIIESIKKEGNWEDVDDMLGNTYSSEKISKMWELIDTYNEYEFRKNKMGTLYVLFEKNNDEYTSEYISVGFVNLRPINLYKLPYKNLMEEIGMGVLKSKRRQGLAKYMYKTLLKQYNILSDKEQYENNIKLWISLSKDFNIDIVDIKNQKIIDKKVDLYDNKYYNIIWNNDSNVRLVLYK